MRIFAVALTPLPSSPVEPGEGDRMVGAWVA